MSILQIFKEESEKWSFGRVIGSIAFLAYFLFAGYSVWNEGKFPDIPGNLALLIGSLYGLNKIAKFVGNK